MTITVRKIGKKNWQKQLILVNRAATKKTAKKLFFLKAIYLRRIAVLLVFIALRIVFKDKKFATIILFTRHLLPLSLAKTAKYLLTTKSTSVRFNAKDVFTISYGHYFYRFVVFYRYSFCLLKSKHSFGQYSE